MPKSASPGRAATIAAAAAAPAENFSLPAPRSGTDARPFAQDVPDYGSDHAKAIRVLQSPGLLTPYWKSLLRTVLHLQAHDPRTCDTSLYWDLLRIQKLTMYFYGQTGAGKSQLIKVLTGSEAAKPSSDETKRTKNETVCEAGNGIRAIDTKGFKWPEAKVDPKQADPEDFRLYQQTVKTFKERCTVLHNRIRKGNAEQRPIAVVVCLDTHDQPPVMEHLVDMLRTSHDLLVPTFLVLTNKFAAGGDEKIAEREEYCKAVKRALGNNKLGDPIHIHTVNSVPFQSTDGDEVKHPEGIAELVTKMLQAFQPSDGLSFARPPKEATASAVARGMGTIVSGLGSVLGKRSEPEPEGPPPPPPIPEPQMPGPDEMKEIQAKIEALED